jgi:hypothetical protein
MDLEYEEYKKQINEHYSAEKIMVIKEKHERYVRNIISNQGVEYNKLVEKGFFLGCHETIQIIELKDCVDYLKHGLDIEIIEKKCRENPILRQLRDSLLCSIFSVTSNDELSYLYGPTIRVLIKILDFYDIIIRSIKEVPPYYHKYRYERYVEFCISFKDLFIFPTFAYIGATDLIKLRPYPLFPVGMTLTLEFVDEYFQTPIEFFIHDINHSRRMIESNISDMLKNGLDIQDQSQVTEYYNQSEACLQKVLDIMKNTIKAKEQPQPNVSEIHIPSIAPDGSKSFQRVFHLDIDDYSRVNMSTPIDQGYSQIIKIIVFEITHEDALPMREDVICSTILRNSGIETIFPRLSQEGKVINSIVYGGSILGFVKYKLRNGFFDSLEHPLDIVVKHFYRTDNQIAIATKILLSKLCNNTVTNNSSDDERILINITDKEGLNLPVNEDLIVKFMPEVLADEKYGDLPEAKIYELRTKNNITEENLYTGERPKPVTEQEKLLTKLGGTKKRFKSLRKKKKRSRRLKLKKA